MTKFRSEVPEASNSRVCVQLWYEYGLLVCSCQRPDSLILHIQQTGGFDSFEILSKEEEEEN